MLWMNFEIFCRYETLWDGPVAMVAYSFGGLVLKSLVVEMHKYVYQQQTNNLDVKVQKCCEKFLKFFKGVVFYNVPHVDGTRDLSNYFKWQHQQIPIRYFGKYGIFQPKNGATFHKLCKFYSQRHQHLCIC
jgi:hypothetical protein